MAPRGADASERSTGIRTYKDVGKNKVVATTADPTIYVRGNATNTQEMRRAEAADEALNKQRGYVRHVPVITSPTVVNASNTALNGPSAFTNAITNLGNSGSGSSGPKYGDVTDRMKLTENARQFGISTSADKTQNDIVNGLNQAQFDLQKATTAQGRADAKAKFDALKNYYDTEGYKTGFDELNTIATGQYNTGVTGLQGTYDRAKTNLDAGYNLAQGITDQGYNTLQNYLQQNPNNPFVGLQQQVQPVANPMQQFLSAYGVSGEPVQAQVAAEQFAGEQGAGAFNSLADILRSAAQQSDASRMAEMQMGRTMANSSLGANRANYQAQNAQAQAQALAQLQQQLSGQQFGIQQNQMQAGQDIYNQILAATGNYGATGGESNTGTEPIMNLPNFNAGPVNQNTGLSPEALQAMEARRGMGVNPVRAVVQPPVVQNSGFSPEALQALMARRGM